MNKIKVLSLFSGIGAFEKALKNIDVDYELINFCEFDKHAIKSYCAIHNEKEEKNLGDITKIDLDNLPTDIDLLTHGSPCQSFSIAGTQHGGDEGSGTPSSLMWHTVKIVERVKPKVIIWENVKNVLSKKHKHNFEKYLEILDEYGYNNYYKVLNAKNYKIPQNRERIFVVSIRKDIDNKKFQFPTPYELKLRLKDIMDDIVDEKYYLKNIDIERFIKTESQNSNEQCIQVGFLDRPTTHDFSNRVYSPEGIARTLMGSGGNNNDKAGQYLIKPNIYKIEIPQTVKVRKYPVDCKLLCECLRNCKKESKLSNKEIATSLDIPITMVEHWFRQDDCFSIPDANIWFELKSLLNINTDKFDKAVTTFEEKEGVFEKANRCYFSDGIAPTITSTSADEKVIVKNNLWTETQTKMITSDGNIKRYIHSDVIDKFEVGQSADISFPNGYNKANRVHDTMPALNNTTTKSSFIYKESQSPLRIRKLTSKECWRLMGFDDKDFEKAAKVNSETQLYKQAGNSICVTVLEEIFKVLYNK